MKFNRRQFIKSAAAVSTVAALPGAPFIRSAAAADTIKVGILHSLTGTIAIAEASVVDAEKLAIEEINAAGGVMGKKLEVVVEDGASDWPTCLTAFKRLSPNATRSSANSAAGGWPRSTWPKT